MANPTLTDFRTRFPELSDADNQYINVFLGVVPVYYVDSNVWGDDFTEAVLLFTAHLVQLVQIQLAASAGGGTGETDLFIRSISFGERRVVFAQREESKRDEGMAAPGESLLDETIYGQLYLLLRGKNVIPVLVV